MSRKRRKKKAPEPAKPRTRVPLALGIAGALIVAGAIGLAIRSRMGAPADAPADPAAMEPQVAEAIEQARKAAEREPDSSTPWGRLGMVYHAHGLLENAARAYARAVELAPEAFEWHYLRARTLEATNPEETLREASEAARLKPDDAPSRVVMARVHELLDEPAEALRLYQEAAAIDPSCAEALYGVGRLSLERGDTKRAIEKLSRAAEIQPEVSATHASLAQALLRAGERERAREEAARAREMTGELVLDDPWMRAVEELSVSTLGMHRRAKRALERGDAQAAERLYRRLAALEGADFEVQFNLGLVLTVRGKLDEANEAFRTALEMRPDFAPAHLHAGINFLRLGRMAEAERHLRAAVELEPRNGVSRRWLAELLLSRGDVAGAREHARMARELGTELSPELEDALGRR